jgi:hypothetical protein
MKMIEALEAIRGEPRRYIVSFEVRERGMLKSDHFPDVREGEEGIESLEEAWRLAQAFASARKQDVVNVCVSHAENFAPVEGYQERVINRYP